MTYGVAIVIAAVGAILRYAVSDSVEGVDLRLIGLILMVAGAVGLVMSVIHAATTRRTRVYEEPRTY